MQNGCSEIPRELHIMAGTCVAENQTMTSPGQLND